MCVGGSILLLKFPYMLLCQIAVLIEDKELVDSFMGGKPWKAGKFALSLRLSLWSEHLGLLPSGEVGILVLIVYPERPQHIGCKEW